MDASSDTIIVAIDESAAAQRAVEVALDLADEGTTLDFVHAVDTMNVCLPVAEGALIDPAPLLKTLQDDANKLCESALEQARERGITARPHVIDGPPAAAIRRFAADQSARMIVIGTHARVGMARLVSGSVAETVFRLSEIPVLVVHADDARRSGPIGVAVDDSDPAQAAFALALRIAHNTAQRLELIHVKASLEHYESPPFLNHFAAQARTAGVSFGTTVCGGNVADEIVRVVEELDCSAIIMGTNGRNSLQRLVHSSIANAVVEAARVPVTVVRTAHSAAPTDPEPVLP